MYLLQVLALELSDQLVQALIICVDADRFQDSFNVLGGRRGIAAEPEEEVSCEVLHVGCATSSVRFASS